MANIAIFASGTGSNFEAIAHHIKETKAPIKIAALICDQPQAAVIDRAKNLKINVWCHALKEFENKTKYEQSILDYLKPLKVDLLVLAGYMKIITPVLLNAYPKQIINIHPALLPAFPGKSGIEDAYNYGVKVTGVTIHWVDQGVDTGPIIAQKGVPILPDETIDQVAIKIHQVEHQLYFESLCQVLEQRKLI